jgi:hypothetical protein
MDSQPMPGQQGEGTPRHAIHCRHPKATKARPATTRHPTPCHPPQPAQCSRHKTSQPPPPPPPPYHTRQAATMQPMPRHWPQPAQSSPVQNSKPSEPKAAYATPSTPATPRQPTPSQPPPPPDLPHQVRLKAILFPVNHLLLWDIIKFDTEDRWTFSLEIGTLMSANIVLYHKVFIFGWSRLILTIKCKDFIVESPSLLTGVCAIIEKIAVTCAECTSGRTYNTVSPGFWILWSVIIFFLYSMSVIHTQKFWFFGNNLKSNFSIYSHTRYRIYKNKSWLLQDWEGLQ